MQHKYLLQTLLVLTLTLIPATGRCAPSVSVNDSIAGLGSEMVLSGFQADETVTVAVIPPYGPEYSMEIPTDTNGAGRAWIPATELELSGTYSVIMNDATEATSFRVFPGGVDVEQSTLEAGTAMIDIGGEPTRIRVTLRDAYGNPLPGRSVELISSRSGDSVAQRTKETDSNGNQEFAVTTMQEGEISLRAIDMLSGKVLQDELHIAAGSIGNSMGGTYARNTTAKKFYRDTNRLSAQLINGVSVYAQTAPFDELGGFRIEIYGQEYEPVPQLQVNEFYSVTITALDKNGDVFQGYQGTVYMLSTDPAAELPKDGVVQFRFEDQGVKQFTLGMSFRTPGNEPHTIIITDNPTEVRNVLGELDVLVWGQQTTNREESIIVLSPQNGTKTNQSTITVEGEGPPFINIVVTGGRNDARGETDNEGLFSVQVQLDETQIEHTLQVQDTSGNYASEEFVITTDLEPPELNGIAFIPENPVEGSDVLFVLESEEDLSAATLKIGEETYSLQAAAEAGKYQVLFTAPTGGVYEPVITMTDESGNTEEVVEALAVGLKGLPQVQNVVAEPQSNAIELTWDPITEEEVEAYRIYVGTAPDEFLYTLDTDRPTAAAIVAGLQPGSTYYFAVTGLRGKRESTKKSVITQATVLGVALDVTPQDGALLLEWESLEKNLPLATFLLEYGVEAEKFTEQRMLNGALRAYTLRDLMNGIPYYLRLTPITTTGEPLDELAAKGSGTPVATTTGFHPAAADPIPDEFDPTAHTGAPQTPTPGTTPGTGIPFAGWIALAGGALFVMWRTRKRKEIKMAHDFLRAMEGRYNQP